MKTLAFGDSFVKMFIHCEDVKHFKYKGKSIKGLVKSDDIQRKKIEREIRKTPNAKRVLFIFGQVDFNYVRYYKAIKDEPFQAREMLRNYVAWASTLNYSKKISIVSIFPSPIEEEHLIMSLIRKGSYLKQQQTPQLDERILKESKKSHETWKQWNGWIAQFCKQYKVNNIVLFKEDFVPPEFRDLSSITIHLRYVPVLKLMKKFIDINFDQEKAELEERVYQKQKTDRIALSIALEKEEIEQEKQKQNEEEEATKEQSSSKDYESPSQGQLVSSQPKQESEVKNYRKKTVDLESQNLESEKSKQKEVLSDSRSDKRENSWKRNENIQNKKQFREKTPPSPQNKASDSESSSDEGEQFFAMMKSGQRRF